MEYTNTVEQHDNLILKLRHVSKETGLSKITLVKKSKKEWEICVLPAAIIFIKALIRQCGM